MAGAGFDAAMIRDAGNLKDRIGRLGYVLSGTENLGFDAFDASVKVDGVTWYEGKASCILLGNVGELFGGVDVFESARPDDGMLEVGVVTAEGVTQWARMIARTMAGTVAASPFVRTAKARTVDVKLDRKVRYELDGGDRSKVKSFKVKVEPWAIKVCTPAAVPDFSRAAGYGGDDVLAEDGQTRGAQHERVTP
jgi:diacylglycerol kinase family enzyme